VLGGLAISKGVVAACVVGALGGGALLAVSGLSGDAGANAAMGLSASSAPDPLERPRRASPRYTLTTFMKNGAPESRIRVAGDTIEVDLEPAARDPKMMSVAILGFDDEADTVRLRIDRCDDRESPFAAAIGQVFEADLVLTEGRMRIVTPMKDSYGWPVKFEGVRPPDYHADAKAARGTARVPGMAGIWHQTEDWDLRLQQDAIQVLVRDYEVHRFRIIDWEAMPGEARVQAICTDSMDPRLVGDRVKLLVRRDAEGFTLAYHRHNSRRLNAWPGGFEPKIGDDLHIMSWGAER
ncbi:MAG: hypothetical protein AAF235_12090, partial [Planctomycetota bacterium]